MLTLYVMFAWVIGICYGFVLISSAANDVNLFQVGEGVVYRFQSTVLLNENSEDAKNVGFSITGTVSVACVWGHQQDKLLKFEKRSPQLHIRSRKAPSPDGFIEHSSKLESYTLTPFYAVWKSGRVSKILMGANTPVALANLQKGVASLFQFQVLDVEANETDSSGMCKTAYETLDSLTFRKTKTQCLSPDLAHVKSTDSILGVEVTSSRRVVYELDHKLTHLATINSKERHRMVLAAKEDLGSVVEADLILNHVRTEKTEQMYGGSLKEVVDSLGYVEDSLQTRKEDVVNEDAKTFTVLVNELRESIADKNLGNLVSAKAFLKLLNAARTTNKEEIANVLASKKNQKILAQIYDVLGCIQTADVYNIVTKKLHFERDDHQDLSERYLWSLSMSNNPNPEILKDLLSRYRKNDNYPHKVKETLILTIAKMAHVVSLTLPEERKLVKSVEESIVNNLGHAKDEERFVFLRALKNLKSASTIPTLLNLARGSYKEGVLAFKALQSMDSSLWDYRVLQAARRAFLQLDKKYDSSSRTLAVDLLLESQPSDQLLTDMLHYLKLNDSSVEVKQYVMQKLQMLADEDSSFNQRLVNLVRGDSTLNNYAVLAPRGLSTALKRTFLRSPSSNGSLLTIQEIFGGIVKRGIVNVMMDKKGVARELFSLGIFAGGLSGMLGSEVEGDDSTATAGMELTILGTQIRPFVFFSGQGELMGHVWSGTASERTTAFQSLILLQDHVEYIRVGPGFVAELSLKTALSFDLSGNIEISIWGRSADSVVQKSAGVVTQGLIAIDADFVRSQIEFSASLEPKLNLKSDLDFSGNMNLCMRVAQPDTIFRHNIYKIERIPGSKHKIRIAKYKKLLLPGTTYSLNRKNDEMCSAMFV